MVYDKGRTIFKLNYLSDSFNSKND